MARKYFTLVWLPGLSHWSELSFGVNLTPPQFSLAFSLAEQTNTWLYILLENYLRDVSHVP